MEQILQDNRKIFAFMGSYLNHAPDLIGEAEIGEIVQNGVTAEYAFKLLLAAKFGLDILENPGDKELFNHYFHPMIHQLDTGEYEQNPYYRNIRIPAVRIGGSELKYECYKPFEGFVFNDIQQTAEGRQIPQVGFFPAEFKYPAVLEQGRVWMTVTPNEIETMKQPVAEASGRVLTFGLGLGYFAYMVAEKDDVDSVTIVEINEDVIRLFKQHLLPQFKQAHKIHVVHAEAFEFARTRLAQDPFDYVFTDLWHDVSDGIDLYLQMKQVESQHPGTKFSYWIEKSIRCYL
ncbi:MAG: hypothetical protein E7E23_20255 [Paenibacillus sp.]|jgi:hypothetical protein|uniref:spermine/spermidine synthase domain-containing protein n=1 Tax=Paenibacillus sp. TaxID=58172 RepID=UPI002902EACF|nr:hypothetical protein [Paenibacillus sp.]MDU2242903.1 hypothetical protein [Paenibacillus sp.]